MFLGYIAEKFGIDFFGLGALGDVRSVLFEYCSESLCSFGCVDYRSSYDLVAIQYLLSFTIPFIKMTVCFYASPLKEHDQLSDQIDSQFVQQSQCRTRIKKERGRGQPPDFIPWQSCGRPARDSGPSLPRSPRRSPSSLS